MPRKKNPEGVKSKRNPNGMGGFYKTKNGYEWRQMVDGDMRIRSAKTLTELQEKVKEIAALPIVKNKMKVSEWFDRWLKTVESLRKSATYNQYSTLYNEHIKPSIGKRKLTTIKRYDIQNIITEMSTKTRHKRVKNKKTGEIEKVDTGEKLSTWTMKHTRKVLKIAFGQALRDKLISENPVTDIELPKRQAKTRKTLTNDELNVMFKYLPNTRWYWAFKFLLVTGMRREEILALKWSNIDYGAKQITVEEAQTDEGTSDTKSSKVHYVTLTENAENYLLGQSNMLKKENNPILHDEKLKSSDLIFPSKNGTPMKPDSLNSVLDRMNKKTGIHVTPHMFRHTYVYLSKGVLTIPELQENLGHDSATSTTDIYGAILADSHKVANKLNEAFKNLDSKPQESDSNIVTIDELRKRKAK